MGVSRQLAAAGWNDAGLRSADCAQRSAMAAPADLLCPRGIVVAALADGPSGNARDLRGAADRPEAADVAGPDRILGGPGRPLARSPGEAAVRTDDGGTHGGDDPWEPGVGTHRCVARDRRAPALVDADDPCCGRRDPAAPQPASQFCRAPGASRGCGTRAARYRGDSAGSRRLGREQPLPVALHFRPGGGAARPHAVLPVPGRRQPVHQRRPGGAEASPVLLGVSDVGGHGRSCRPDLPGGIHLSALRGAAFVGALAVHVPVRVLRFVDPSRGCCGRVRQGRNRSRGQGGLRSRPPRALQPVSGIAPVAGDGPARRAHQASRRRPGEPADDPRHPAGLCRLGNLHGPPDGSALVGRVPGAVAALPAVAARGVRRQRHRRQGTPGRDYRSRVGTRDVLGGPDPGACRRGYRW